MASSLPEKILEKAKSVFADLLPNKSGDKYKHTYNLFMKWKSDENIPVEDFSEDVLITYFSELSRKDNRIFFIRHTTFTS